MREGGLSSPKFLLSSFLCPSIACSELATKKESDGEEKEVKRKKERRWKRKEGGEGRGCRGGEWKRKRKEGVGRKGKRMRADGKAKLKRIFGEDEEPFDSNKRMEVDGGAFYGRDGKEREAKRKNNF